MKDRVIEIISNELSIAKEKITLESRLSEDLGADSLDAVELIMALEDEFNVTVPDDVAQAMKTVNDIVSFLDK